MKANESYPNYKIKKLIGKGVFGYVFQALDLNSKKQIAWKRMQKSSKKMSREFEILEKLKDKENVLQIDKIFYSLNFKNDLMQNFIVEFCDYDLEKILKLMKTRKIKFDFLTLKKVMF